MGKNDTSKVVSSNKWTCRSCLLKPMGKYEKKAIRHWRKHLFFSALLLVAYTHARRESSRSFGIRTKCRSAPCGAHLQFHQFLSITTTTPKSVSDDRSILCRRCHYTRQQQPSWQPSHVKVSQMSLNFFLIILLSISSSILTFRWYDCWRQINSSKEINFAAILARV